MEEKHARLYFRLKEIDETKDCFLEEIKHKKHENTNKTLNYLEHLLILASIIVGCVSISAFAFTVGIPLGITSSADGLNIFV